MNSFLQPISKMCILNSAFAFSILMVSKRVPFMQLYLSNYVFSFIIKLLYPCSLMLPVVSKTFAGTVTHSLTASPQFSFYTTAFSLIISLIFGLILNVWLEQPWIDMLKMGYFKLKNKIINIKRIQK